MDHKCIAMTCTRFRRGLFAFLFAICVTFFTSSSFAAEETTDGRTTITSETLEYEKASTTYTARGKARIERNDAVLEADEIRFNETTSEASASGNVRYRDPDVLITAGKADLNLEAKTGMLYDTSILYKKDNYHFSGRIIEKRGGKYYFSPDAVFTTCDAPSPPWCFRGKDVNVLATDSVRAKGVTFRIMDVPVLYSPYFQAPILNERKTGLLMPVIGYGEKRGAHLNLPFFLVLSENRDATVVLDEYSKRGLGQGLEYRYLEAGGAKGKWWLYHIRDRKLHQDFLEAKVLHEQRSAERLGGVLSVNYVNEKDFYREYSLSRDIRYTRFLESTAELSLPLPNSRAYLLSQYWVDLKTDTKTFSHRLPEVGYVLNPVKAGNFWFSGTAAFTNFWSEHGIDGRRIDFFPRATHSFGDDIMVLQSLGLRETVYSLNGTVENSPHREALEYRIAAHASLLKRYQSLTHVIEPSVGYSLISDSDDDLYQFDETEAFKRESRIWLGLLSRLLDKNGEILVFRASQGYDTYQVDGSFLPLTVEVGLKRPFFTRFGATYDVETGELQTANSDVSVKISDTIISAGQRYNAKDNTSFISAGINLHPFQPLYLASKVWYDVKDRAAKDVVVSLKYLRQCWGINLQFVKKPGDFNIVFLLELKGITKEIKP